LQLEHNGKGCLQPQDNEALDRASPPDQYNTWFNNAGGGNQIKAILNDQVAIHTDAQAYVAGNLDSADGAKLQSDAATLQADTQAAQANLPPASIPGMRSDYSSALTDYNTESIDLDNGVIAANAGDYSSGTIDLQAALTSQSNGTGKLQAAIADKNNAS
jgi:hypothetical protein